MPKRKSLDVPDTRPKKSQRRQSPKRQPHPGLRPTTRDEPDDAQLSKKVLFSTPTRRDKHPQSKTAETPIAIRNDRSARKRSQRILVVHDSDVEEDEFEGEVAIAQQIWDDEEATRVDDGDTNVEEVVVVEEEEEEEEEPSLAPEPTAKAGRRRGRPGKLLPSPSPPPDLTPHERYFLQNRTGTTKTSASTLAADQLLNHDDYLAQINAHTDPHAAHITRLGRLHERAFDQWNFELDAGFNLCLYGYGSKRSLVMEFAERVYDLSNGRRTIVVFNGYAPGTTIREMLITLAQAALPKGTKLPTHPNSLVDLLLSSLTGSSKITLVMHSLDHIYVRKSATQSLLARLAAHPSISLIATCDTPHFPLLWDAGLVRQFHFLFHDATTFQPYTIELDAVEEVNTLLGRHGTRLNGKDGVHYVLQSLPENARALFRILVAEQLALADTTAGEEVENNEPVDMLGAEHDEDALHQQPTPARRARRQKQKLPPMHGVEYRTLYQKAVEEFVCSSELSFRTLLKEFRDHQMVDSTRDAAGTEKLSVPFGRTELEGLLESLV
ncbi:ORC2-domain-containing protein [Piedraia hortae CBS 480.64]|uniref:Origin recognition complex subunit 2 n=1 Tax=Piedraia hortae CBS 480.64 TaxID=1314780 RepID=A0A6A7BQX8_9PEZI|nr:ORC2-domain-containing protein [Piedraia hortae CBS 480.64]